jgi:hypothetical protein
MDYLGSLRALNRYDDPGPIIRAFETVFLLR